MFTDSEAKFLCEEELYPESSLSNTAGGSWHHQKPNCAVFYNSQRGILEIWPAGGGWLGVPIETVMGDMAPGHG